MKYDPWFILLTTALFSITVPGCAPSTPSNPDTDSVLPSDNTTDTTDTIDTTDTTDTNDGNTNGDTDAPALWGWISAIEWNDTCDQWYMISNWGGGVRAYFAETATYSRALPHTLDFIPKVAEAGSCRLYDAGIIANCSTPDDCFTCVDFNFECWRVCNYDQECEQDTEGFNTEDYQGTCHDLPRHSNMGTITLTGFKEQLILEPDQYDRYYTTTSLTNPNNLFDDGDELTAKTEGGVLPALSFSTKGVAPLEISNPVVELMADNSATVRWTPADTDSRIQIAIMSGSHDPNPLTAEILCDVPDSDGSVEIPASLVNGLLAETCEGEGMGKCSRITRYTRDVKTLQGKEIELFVGSARNLQLSIISK